MIDRLGSGVAPQKNLEELNIFCKLPPNVKVLSYALHFSESLRFERVLQVCVGKTTPHDSPP